VVGNNSFAEYMQTLANLEMQRRLKEETNKAIEVMGFTVEKPEQEKAAEPEAEQAVEEEPKAPEAFEYTAEEQEGSNKGPEKSFEEKRFAHDEHALDSAAKDQQGYKPEIVDM